MMSRLRRRAAGSIQVFVLLLMCMVVSGCATFGDFLKWEEGDFGWVKNYTRCPVSLYMNGHYYAKLVPYGMEAFGRKGKFRLRAEPADETCVGRQEEEFTVSNEDWVITSIDRVSPYH
jgi:hypothetical protein